MTAIGVGPTASGDSAAIRPFRVNVSEPDLTELRPAHHRHTVARTRTGDGRLAGRPVGDGSGTCTLLVHPVRLRTCETKLNALPQFITEIDGLDIHFIHVRSRHDDALPLIVTHGWPGSIVEQLKIIDPLTNPTAHGASGSDAFHLVIPSIPGYGFSGKPTTAGWHPGHVAHAWVELMKRLGYRRFVAQGGDVGAFVRRGTAEFGRKGARGATTPGRQPSRDGRTPTTLLMLLLTVCGPVLLTRCRSISGAIQLLSHSCPRL